MFGIRFGREQAQRAMRSFVVMKMPVIGEDDAGFTQRVDEFTVQALAAELIVKALHVAVLPRTSRVNIDRLDPSVPEPLLDRCSNKLWPVVRADILGCTMFLNGFFEDAQHVRCLDRTVRVDAVAFLRKLVDQIQAPQFPSKDRMVANEIPRPDMISMLRLLRKPSRDALTPFARLGSRHL